MLSATDRQVIFWSQRTATVLKLLRVRTHDVALAPHGRWAIAAGYDGELRWLPADKNERQKVVAPASTGVDRVAVGAGDRIALARQGGLVELRDSPDSDTRFEAKLHGDVIYAVRFDAAGETLVTAGGDGKIALVDTQTGGVERVIESGAPVFDARISPDGKSVASIASDGVKLWARADGSLLQHRP